MGLLRASPSRLALMRSWDVDLQRLGVSFKVNGSAGVTYQGAHRVCAHADAPVRRCPNAPLIHACIRSRTIQSIASDCIGA